MANDDDDFDDGVDPDFDARARSAGRALRESAPADGLGRVRAARRRRTVLQAGGAVAAVVLAVGGIVALTRSGDTVDVADVPSTAPAVTSPQSTGTAPGVATSEATTGETTPSAATDDTTPATEPADTTPAEPAVDYVSAGFYAGPEWVGDRTTAITDPLADGLYWSDEYRSDGNTVSFRLVQRIRGDACVEEFGDSADTECASDSGRITEPSATITMTADGVDTSVISTVGVGAGSGFEAFRVPSEEFIRLAAGGSPSPGAPDGYSWVPFGVGVVVSGGRVVAAHQQFSS
jgi:hypothetical protein